MIIIVNSLGKKCLRTSIKLAKIVILLEMTKGKENTSSSPLMYHISHVVEKKTYRDGLPIKNVSLQGLKDPGT